MSDTQEALAGRPIAYSQQAWRAVAASGVAIT
jgi:hypothetical protein